MMANRKRILSDDQIEEMARLKERGWSATRIAEHFAKQGTKVSPGAINWQCLLVGADAPRRLRGKTTQPTEPYRRGAHLVVPYTAADDALILKLEAEGKGTAAIARALNPPRKPNSVKGRLLTLARRQARAEDAGTPPESLAA